MKRREEVDKLRDMPDEDLQAEAARLKESLFRLNFKLALGEIDAVKKMRQEKRSMARLRAMVATQAAALPCAPSNCADRRHSSRNVS